MSFNTKIISFSILILILISSTLSLLVFIKPLNVNSVNLNGEENLYEFNNQIINIEFNFPISKDQIKEKIEIVPNADFDVVVSGNTLNIVFRESLKSDSSYTLYLFPEIKSITNKELNSSFSYEFKTRSNQFALIENLENSEVLSFGSINDLENTIELFRNDEIKLFDVISENEFVVVFEENESDQIFFKSDELKFNSTFQNRKIINVFIEPLLNRLFVLYQDTEIINGFINPISEIKLVSVDLSKNYSESKINLEISIADVKNLRDGRTLAIREFSSPNYYLFDIARNELLLLGKFYGFSDLDLNQNRALFSTFEETNRFILMLDSNRNQINLTDGKESSIDPKFVNSNLIIFSKLQESKTQNIRQYGLSLLSINELELKDSLSLDNKSIELPEVSIDGSYISAEIYDLEISENPRIILDLPRNLDSEIIILKLENDKLITTDIKFIGRDFRWI